MCKDLGLSVAGPRRRHRRPTSASNTFGHCLFAPGDRSKARSKARLARSAFSKGLWRLGPWTGAFTRTFFYFQFGHFNLDMVEKDDRAKVRVKRFPWSQPLLHGSKAIQPTAVPQRLLSMRPKPPDACAGPAPRWHPCRLPARSYGHAHREASVMRRGALPRHHAATRAAATASSAGAAPACPFAAARLKRRRASSKSCSTPWPFA